MEWSLQRQSRSFFQDPSSYPFVYNAATFCNGIGGSQTYDNGPSSTSPNSAAAFSYNLLLPPPLTPGSATSWGNGSGGTGGSNGGLWFPPSPAAASLASSSSPWSSLTPSSPLTPDGGFVQQQDVYSIPATFTASEEHVSCSFPFSALWHHFIHRLSVTQISLLRWKNGLFDGIK